MAATSLQTSAPWLLSQSKISIPASASAKVALIMHLVSSILKLIQANDDGMVTNDSFW